MFANFTSLLFRGCLVFILVQPFCLVPATPLCAKEGGLRPFRLSYGGSSEKGLACEFHAPAPSEKQVKKTERKGGRPPAVYESEHRPVPERSYQFNYYRRWADITAYVRRPDGTVIEPQLVLGNRARVSFPTVLADGPHHGAHSVYVVEQGVSSEVFTIRTAKWITMHHSCGWGHNKKFDDKMIHPQPLDTIPFEIVIDKLWDPNFHLSVSSGDTVKITVLSYGKPVSEALVTLSSDKNWTKEVVTDKNGNASIQMIRDYYPPLWAKFKRSHRGNFLVTAQYTPLKNPLNFMNGNFKGDSYNQVNYVTTLPWMYTPSLNDYTSYSYGLGVGVLAMMVSGLGVFVYRERRKKPYKGISFDK